MIFFNILYDALHKDMGLNLFRKGGFFSFGVREMTEEFVSTPNIFPPLWAVKHSTKVHLYDIPVFSIETDWETVVPRGFF